MMKRSNDERIAYKYCFRAIVHLLDKPSGRIVGTFTGFDKTPTVAALAAEACRHHLSMKPVSDCAECSEPELTMYTDCPSECSGDITFVFHKVDDEDSV